jgi:hypothetical protein
MKERILFIAGIVGSFSATIVLFINHALVLLGVDTSGYVDIINIVGLVLSILILIAAMIFLNKYNGIQQKYTAAQNGLVATALDGNATLMQTLLPTLANNILQAADDRSNTLLKSAEAGINNMMTKLLPALAEQTMQIVTQQSRDLVEQTTAKANTVMQTMDELLPTYAKHISDSVAQTVRENNAHYHKMLTEVKSLFVDVCKRPDSSQEHALITHSVEELVNRTQTNFEQLQTEMLNSMTAVITKLLTMPTTVAVIPAAPIVEIPEVLTTQNDETDEKSDETSTE